MIPTNPHITYQSPKGREYRSVYVEKIVETEKWINKVLKFHWIVTIKYIDNNEIKKLFYDHNDKLYKTDS